MNTKQTSLNNISKRELRGADPRILTLVTRLTLEPKCPAFFITDCVRSEAEQRKLFASGATKTMKSKHLLGRAIDVALVVDGKVRWEVPLYEDFALIVRDIARQLGIFIRWGGSWEVLNLTLADWAPHSAIKAYASTQLKSGKRPLIDACHFEIFDE